MTYKSSDDAIATVDANGEVTGVKAGKATITATMTCGTKVLDRETEVSVNKVLLQDAAQTEYNKIKLTILGDTTGLKAADFKVTNKSTNGTVPVKSVDPVKNEAGKFVITTHISMLDAKEYVVAYAGSETTFTATDGTVAKVGVSRTQVPAGEEAIVQLTTTDANDVVLSHVDLDKTGYSRGDVSAETTFAKGYVNGTKVYLPSVGDTMTVKVTYHTGTYGTDGKEVGNIEGTFTITAVDPSVVNYNYAVTILPAPGAAPAWKADSFVVNDKIAVENTGYAYFRIVNDSGADITNYIDYEVESADKTKLLVQATSLAANGTGGTTGVAVQGISEGTTYILIKKADTKAVVASLPVTVLGKAVATTLDLSKTSVNVVDEIDIPEYVQLALKDQYGAPKAIDKVEIELVGKPNNSITALSKIAASATTVNVEGNTLSVKGNSTLFDQKGTYTFKISATNNADKMTLVRTLQVVVVANAGDSTYQIRINKPTVDTTIGTGTVDPDATNITLSLARLKNGGVVNDVVSEAVTYTIKNAKGETVLCSSNVDAQAVTGAAMAASASAGNAVTLKPITTNGGSKYDKNLPAGTYTVIAEATIDTKPVKATGSFTITDSQNTIATYKFNDNKFGGISVAAAFASTATNAAGIKFVSVYYDGVEQTIAADDVIRVNGKTLTDGGAFISTVTLYVTVSGSSNKIPVTIIVNDQAYNCSGLQ